MTPNNIFELATALGVCIAAFLILADTTARWQAEREERKRRAEIHERFAAWKAKREREVRPRPFNS